MLTDEGRVEADRARDAFNRRLAAANAVAAPSGIDFASYKARLPDVDVDAIKADYQKFIQAIPALTYDESADKGESWEDAVCIQGGAEGGMLLLSVR